MKRVTQSDEILHGTFLKDLSEEFTELV